MVGKLTFQNFVETKEQKVKYPRTFHFPWSPGTTSDDRILKSFEHFLGRPVVVTEKMDGENTTMYSNHIHARSLDSAHHPSRTIVKQLHGQIKHEIPEGWRVCGENLYAKHSIAYDQLPAYFLVFSIWTDKNVCLSWSDTKEWCSLLGLHTVPELYVGLFSEDTIRSMFSGTSKFGGEQEGYVVRTVEGFPYSEFATHVAKYVRKNHVQTSEFWMTQPVVPNRLSKT